MNYTYPSLRLNKNLCTVLETKMFMNQPTNTININIFNLHSTLLQHDIKNV